MQKFVATIRKSLSQTVDIVHPEVDKNGQRSIWLPLSARACLKQWTS